MNRLASFGYLLMFASLLYFGAYMMLHRKETAKKSWPSVPGKMISSQIIKTTRAYLQTPTVNRPMRDDKYYRDVKVWGLDVAYSYQIAGQEFQGSQATASNHVDSISDYPDGPSKQMLDWNAQLTKGTAVSVHYDPFQPNESYVIYTENSGRGSIITASILMILGIALAIAPRMFR